MNPDDLKERMINAFSLLVANGAWVLEMDEAGTTWALNEFTFVDLMTGGDLDIQVAAPDYESALPALEAVATAVAEHVAFMNDV